MGFCVFASLFLSVPDNKSPRKENCQFTLYPYIESVDFGRIALTCDDGKAFAVLPPFCYGVTVLNQGFFRGWPCLFLPIILPQGECFTKPLLIFREQFHAHKFSRNIRHTIIIQHIQGIQIITITATHLNLCFFFLIMNDDIIQITENIDSV